jgi:manganese transport protein
MESPTAVNYASPGGRDQHRSLEDVHSSVAISRGQWWKRLLSFSGPAFMVSVGYMDPGNWATDWPRGRGLDIG